MRRINGVLVIFVVAFSILSIFGTATQVGLTVEECVWHEEIMKNVTFHRLAKASNGESLVIVYKGNGTYPSGLSDVHYYLVFTTNDTGVHDLQAQIELAKIGETTYVMEIYHSVPNGSFSFEIPYEHTILVETTYLTVIRIEDDVCGLLSEVPIVDGTQTVYNPGDGCVWYEEIMQNVTTYGIIDRCDNFTSVVVYEGNGTYRSGLSDVHYYLIYKTDASGVYDLQARIELAKIGDTTYVMEVYHSRPFMSIEMPFEFTIEKNYHYFMKLYIEAALCVQ